jgi:xanthine dehydrogenase small subunit
MQLKCIFVWRLRGYCFTLTRMTIFSPATRNPVKTIRFIRRGEVVSVKNVPPSRTLLELLREDLGHTGSKEGCGEGDCGACTVVLGEAQGGAMTYKAVNSCIRLAHSIDGLALWNVEDLAAADGALHPAQQAMVNCHASQCGFCTPGFVMSLFSMYQNHVCKDKPITRAMAQQELSGNLCRCTGYRPILDAAQAMATLSHVTLDEPALLSKLELLAPVDIGLEADFTYQSPRTLAALLQARAAQPDAQLVAGCTDVGLWVTKQHREFEQVIDVTQVQELRRIEQYEQHIAIGAAVTLHEAFAALALERPQLQNFFNRFAGLPVRNSGTLGGNVANGSPIGDSMPLLIALGAHVVLMSVRGHRELALERLYTSYRSNVMAGDEVLAWIKVPRPGSPHPCPLPMGEGVRKTEDKKNQVPELVPSPIWEEEIDAEKNSEGGALPELAPSPLRAEGIHAGKNGDSKALGEFAPSPLRAEGIDAEKNSDGKALGEFTPSPLWGEGWGEGLPEWLQVYKISKRFDDDISAVCLAINLQISNERVVRASIGAGGVAATPVRAIKTEAALLGQPWSLQTVQLAMEVLCAEFTPISDMRASAAYRSQVLGNLLQRYWLESQGAQQINLASFVLDEAA